MKLVNVEDLKVLVAVESKGEIRYGKLVTDLFDDIQTVDAIPKQWLRELQTRYLKEDCLMSVGIVNEIMNLWDFEKDKWEKENAKEEL